MDRLSVSVAYRSRGALLVCGDAERVRAALPLLPSGLKTLAVVDGGLSEATARPSVRVVPGAVVQIRGHLGCFRAGVAGPDGELDLGPLSVNGDGLFDLVLDLYEHPLNDLEVTPLGYVRTRGRTDRLESGIARFQKLIGTVNKPCYLSFDEALCAFDRQGVQGCRRCLDSCPAGAIGSNSDGIRIDPYLCRGCGGCTLACPTGAIRYARPRLELTQRVISELLEQHTSEIAPVLAVHAGESDAFSVPDGVAELKVTAIGSVGPELWLSALAMGASRVIILCSGILQPTTYRVLEAQINLHRRLLGAIGHAPERIRLTRNPRGVYWGGLSNPWPPMKLALLKKQRSKRGQFMTALLHLAHHADTEPGSVVLADGAPFGGLALQEKHCTLCLACVRLCPTGALKERDGALAFAERDCVQCGLCTRGCPENAIGLLPGFNSDMVGFGAERTLKTASEAFLCVQCGTPFASRSLVKGSMAHVHNHPMFRGEGRRLLEMCMNCRQKSTFGIG